MGDGFDRLTGRKTRTAKVTLALDPDDAEKISKAKAVVDRAQRQLDAKPDNDDLKTNLDEATARLDEIKAEVVTATFHLRGIGPNRVEELLAMQEHQPTKAQKEQHRRLHGADPRERLQWNTETFPQALLARSIEMVTFSDDPDGAQTVTDITEARMKELWAAPWSVADRQTLFLQAFLLDQAGSNVEAMGEG